MWEHTLRQGDALAYSFTQSSSPVCWAPTRCYFLKYIYLFIYSILHFPFLELKSEDQSKSGKWIPQNTLSPAVFGIFVIATLNVISTCSRLKKAAHWYESCLTCEFSRILATILVQMKAMAHANDFHLNWKHYLNCIQSKNSFVYKNHKEYF